MGDRDGRSRAPGPLQGGPRFDLLERRRRVAEAGAKRQGSQPGDRYAVIRRGLHERDEAARVILGVPRIVDESNLVFEFDQNVLL